MELWLLAVVTIAGTEVVLRVLFAGGPKGLARIGLHAGVLMATVAALQVWAFFADRRFHREVERSRDKQPPQR